MKLPTIKLPVDYAAQQGWWCCITLRIHTDNSPAEAFVEFLTTFKSSASASEASATTALQGLHIEDEDLSDEYDFMDDVDHGNGPRRRPTRANKEPKLKYKNLLQEIANREKSEITIELDDLEVVRISFLQIPVPAGQLGLLWRFNGHLC
jgi:hypothetical protein